MGLPAPSLKYIIRIFKKYRLSGPILTLGNQDIYADYTHILEYFRQSKLKPKKILNIKYSTSGNLIKINPKAKDYIHATTFFEMLGINNSKYYDIDAFDTDQPKIIHDLQKPIPKKLYNKFNFVVDAGTIEHIFDIKMCMSNIVKITKIGGYVLHLTPTQNFINHGFYQISPTFFYDFYIQNGFEIIEAYYTETTSNHVRFYTYNQKHDYTGIFVNPLNRIGSFFLVRKITQKKYVDNPVQYYYQQIANNPAKSDSDFNRTFFDKLVAKIRNRIPFQLHSFFFPIWYLLKVILQKRKYFDINFK